MSTQPKTTLELIREWATDNRLEVPSDTSRTFDEAGFDSLHLVELAFFLEEKLGLDIDQTVLWNSATFDGFLQYLADRSGAGKPDRTRNPASDDRPIAETAEW